MEEIFEQARFRMGKTVRMRKEALEFYQQNTQNTQRCESNYSSIDELASSRAHQRKAYSDLTTVPKILAQENDSSIPATP